MTQQDKHFVGKKSNQYCEKFSEKISVFGHDKAMLETYSAFGRNKPEQSVMILWIGENRSEKKCVDLFYHRKKKAKKKCWFNPQKQNCAVLCFCLKNTQIRYQLLGRSCKKIQFYFLASKNTFFFSEQKTEQFVWYHTDFSVHFCNFFL